LPAGRDAVLTRRGGRRQSKELQFVDRVEDLGHRGVGFIEASIGDAGDDSPERPVSNMKMEDGHSDTRPVPGNIHLGVHDISEPAFLKHKWKITFLSSPILPSAGFNSRRSNLRASPAIGTPSSEVLPAC
jgi:hypothetical protein